jgi:hypothetical protein
MKSIDIKLSEEEFQNIYQAYQTLQNFLEKILPTNELYHTEFIHGIQEALHEVNIGEIKEVNTFEDFIA